MLRATKIPERFKKDPVFNEIKAELDPLALKFYSLPKDDRKYIQFESCLDNWNKRLVNIMPTLGAVESIQRLQIQLLEKETEDKRRLLTVTGLFRYLGLVESFGSQFVDLIILLLVANGYEFHVERQHDMPRIVHAASLEDLRSSFLGPKIKFLRRCKLQKTSKIVDVNLRNAIAHLNFEVNENGTISVKSRGGKRREINIFQKINAFNHKITILFLLFNQIQEHVFKPDRRLLAKFKEKK